MRSITREQWQKGLAGEVAAWSKWIDDGRAGTSQDAIDDYTWRLDPKADVASHDYLQPYMRPNNPPGATVKVLDVGAGPLTFFPKQWVTRTMQISAIDPLAAEYDVLLKEKSLEPVIRTTEGEAERLTDQFPADHFDLVYCRNAFEQFYDPMRALERMLAVLKPGKWVLLLQEGLRSEEEAPRSPWTLGEEDCELFMQAGEERVDIGLELGHAAHIRVVRAWHWPWLLGGLKKE